MSILGISWRYINEGNAHIVIRIQVENTNTNYVLRLIKNDGITANINEIHKSVNFVNLIMNPLVCNGRYCQLEVIEIPKEAITTLMSDLARFRPRERLIKSHISSYAIKTRNLTILNPLTVNYCVEIKPKEGFMSSGFKKYGKCYYCLKQFLKLQENVIFETSKYCPLDLFSGNKHRMKSALYHLSKNPQNNFKVFKDSEIIFNASNIDQFDVIINKMNIFKSSEAFFDFIIGTLLYKSCYTKIDNYSDNINITEESKTCDNKTNLHNETVLYKILQLQKLSEELSISTKELKLESTDYVTSLLEEIDAQANLYCGTDRHKFLETIDPLHKALISAITKDCSIMITFTPQCETECDKYIEVGENKIPFEVSVTDLEPKLPKTLVKREKTERKLIEVYEEWLKKKGNPTALRNPR